MKNKLRVVMVGYLLMAAAGCSRSPSLDVLGSFFPAWVVCCAAGAALAVVTYLILARIDFHAALPWRPVVYPCLAVVYTFLLWIIFYA